MDVVFSSNVLEHVAAIDAFLDETARVLKPEGRAIHILPTPAWRGWSMLTYYGWLAKRVLGLIAAGAGAGAGANADAAAGAASSACSSRIVTASAVAC